MTLDPRSRLEQAVLWHAGITAVFAAWAFGGQAPWARAVLLASGALAPLLTLAAAFQRSSAGGGAPRAFRWLWPLLAFDLMAVAGTLNPGFRKILVEGQPYWVMVDPIRWLPSAAETPAALRQLGLLNGLFLVAHNLVLVASRRRLRRLIAFLAANAVVLAILGTFQKLVGAPGLWFGAVASPNEFFFSTFIYHNHWGAFVLLNVAAIGGLMLRSRERRDEQDPRRSPVPAAAVALLLLAASVPLSGSRSCTALVGVLAFAIAIHFAVRVGREQRVRGRPAAARVASLATLVAIAVACIVALGLPIIEKRTRHTIEQVEQIRSADTLDARLALYRDTWRMAKDRPFFGWGLDSYGHVFQIYNSQRPSEPWFPKPLYLEAHSDWLQSLAESGWIGTAFLALLGALPAWSAVRRGRPGLLPFYLLAGCMLVVLYAWVEFPFANPAVTLTFWILLHAAVRLQELEPPLRAAGNPGIHA